MKEYTRGLTIIFALPFEFSVLQALVWWRWQVLVGSVPVDSFGVSRWFDVLISPFWVVGGFAVLLIFGAVDCWPATVSLPALSLVVVSYVVAMISGVTLGIIILSVPLLPSLALLLFFGARFLTERRTAAQPDFR